MDGRTRVKDILAAALLIAIIAGLGWLMFRAAFGPPTNGCDYPPLC